MVLATLVQATLVLATLLLVTLVLIHPLSRVASVDLSFAVLDPGQAEILLHRVAGQGGLTRELVLQQVPSTYDCLQSPFRWTCSKSLPPQVDLSTVSPTTLAAAAACLHSFVLHRCFTSPHNPVTCPHIPVTCLHSSTLSSSLTTAQATALLQRLGTSSHRLRYHLSPYAAIWSPGLFQGAGSVLHRLVQDLH